MTLFDKCTREDGLQGIEKSCKIEKVMRGGGEDLAVGGDLYLLNQDAKWQRLPSVPFRIAPGVAIVGTADGFIFTTLRKVANGCITFWTLRSRVWAPVVVNALPRKWHNLLYLPDTQSVLISGGFSDDGGIVGAIEILNCLSLNVSTLETSQPLELSQHFAVALDTDTVAFLGGFSSDGSVNKYIFFLNLTNGELQKVREYAPFDLQSIKSVVACGGNILIATGYTMWMFDVKGRIWLEVREGSIRPSFIVAKDNVFTIYNAEMSNRVTASFVDPIVFFDRVAENNLALGLYGCNEGDILDSELKELGTLEDAAIEAGDDELLDRVLVAQVRREIEKQMLLARDKPGELIEENPENPEDPLVVLSEIEEFKEKMGKEIEKMEKHDHIDLRSLNDFITKYNVQLIASSPPETMETQHSYETLHVRIKGLAQEIVAQEKRVMALLKEQKAKSKILGSQYMSQARLAARMDQEMEVQRGIREEIRKKQTECLTKRKTINEKFMKDVFEPLHASPAPDSLAQIQKEGRVAHQIRLAKREKETILKDISQSLKRLCSDNAKDLPADELESHCNTVRTRLAELCKWTQTGAGIIGDKDLATKCNITDLLSLLPSQRPTPLELAGTTTSVKSAALRDLISRNQEILFGML